MWPPRKVYNRFKDFKTICIGWFNSDTISDVCFFHATKQFNSTSDTSDLPGHSVRSHR